MPAQHDSWLSSRPAARRSPGRPEHRGGREVEQAQVPGGDGAGSHAGCAASHSRNSPSRGLPMPHTGARWACLSSTSPFSFTSRSRWIASCGTRATGSSTATRWARRRAIDQSTGDAEVAVEPRVQQRAAVDLDTQLLPAVTTRASGSGFTCRPGESVWAPTIRNGSVGADPGRAMPGRPARHRARTNPCTGGAAAPRVVEPDLREPGGEQRGGRGCGMPGRRRGVEVGDEIGEVVWS